MGAYAVVKEWRKNNPEKVLEQARRYRAKHPETNKKSKARYRSANIELVRERDRVSQDARRKADPVGQKLRYKRWRARHEDGLTEIAGRPRADICELCGAAGKTVFDHCHAQGHFRGWICDRCNKVLGLIYDDTELLEKMKLYLENNDGKNKISSA